MRSREVFGFGTSSFISGSSSSWSSSFFVFSRTQVLKTRVPCGKYIFMSTIKTRVFEARFLCQTRASKAQDVILLNSFQFLLTNYIVWQTHTTLQITSKFQSNSATHPQPQINSALTSNPTQQHFISSNTTRQRFFSSILNRQRHPLSSSSLFTYD